MGAADRPPVGLAGVTVRCPAKLNLCLSVGAPDPTPGAGGRHPLVSAMLALDWGDDVTITRRPGAGLSLARRWARDAPSPSPIDWPEREDLVWKAAEAFLDAAGLKPGVGLEVVKRVPCGGGLGGGSGDAAGVLLGISRLWPEAVADERLDALAAGLGSDVTFALHALRGRAVAAVSGFGERVEALRVGEAGFHCVLVFPPFGCPTRRVFANLDARLAAGERPGGIGVEEVKAAAALGWSPLVALGNNLSGPAADAQPELRALLRDLAEASLDARVTGSGSTLFIPADGADAAEEAAALAARVTGLPTLAVSGPPRAR